MKRATFCLDMVTDDDGRCLTFDGWTDGETWNGYACPKFEKAAMDALVSAHHSVEAWNAQYDETSDTYIFDTDGVGDSPDDGNTFLYDTSKEAPDGVEFIVGFDKDGVHVYEPQGWTWEEHTPTHNEELAHA